MVDKKHEGFLGHRWADAPLGMHHSILNSSDGFWLKISNFEGKKELGVSTYHTKMG